MGGKLVDNGLWESSRMMLPEHKEALIHQRQGLNRKVRKVLDEQELEEMSRVISQSLHLRKMVKVKMYHEFEVLEIIGIIQKVDTHRFMVDGEWFSFDDIEAAEIDN